MTPELQSKITIWRARAAEGTLSIEEMREAVAVIREGRLGAAHASEASKRSRAKKEIKSADEMLNELEGL